VAEVAVAEVIAEAEAAEVAVVEVLAEVAEVAVAAAEDVKKGLLIANSLPDEK